MTPKELVNKIRNLEIDPNNLQNFFSLTIRSLLVDLNGLMKIRNISVPHMIVNTGDDEMWLIAKGYDASQEPCDITNEHNIYMQVPRGVLNVSSVDSMPDQLSNPYVRGQFQCEIDNELFTLNGECRRMPIKIQTEIQYFMPSYNDVLEMIQNFYTKLVFLRTYKFSYLGQVIMASYKMPDSVSDEHQTELTGTTDGDRNHKVSFNLEIETNIPVYEPRTVVEPKYITHPIINTNIGNDTITRDTATRAGYRSFGRRQH